jgi:hypothetical protein
MGVCNDRCEGMRERSSDMAPEAQRSTEEGREAQDRVKMSRRTVQNAQERLRRATSQVSTTFGESVRRIDAAWPGNHTRCMYDDLSKRQASILAQLRIGMTVDGRKISWPAATGSGHKKWLMPKRTGSPWATTMRVALRTL